MSEFFIRLEGYNKWLGGKKTPSVISVNEQNLSGSGISSVGLFEKFGVNINYSPGKVVLSLDAGYTSTDFALWSDGEFYKAMQTIGEVYKDTQVEEAVNDYKMHGITVKDPRSRLCHMFDLGWRNREEALEGQKLLLKGLISSCKDTGIASNLERDLQSIETKGLILGKYLSFRSITLGYYPRLFRSPELDSIRINNNQKFIESLEEWTVFNTILVRMLSTIKEVPQPGKIILR